MICKKCGELLDDNAKFCSVCGAKQGDSQTYESKLNPVHSHEEACAHEGYVAGSKESVSFVDAFKLFFLRYADFGGRSRRSEYWWASLAIGILGTVISAIVPDLSWIWSLAVMVPGVALCVRRLHDIGKSGWWYLINFVPLVGQIIFLIWACKDSTEDNQWGPNPKT